MHVAAAGLVTWNQGVQGSWVHFLTYSVVPQLCQSSLTYLVWPDIYWDSHYSCCVRNPVQPSSPPYQMSLPLHCPAAFPSLHLPRVQMYLDIFWPRERARSKQIEQSNKLECHYSYGRTILCRYLPRARIALLYQTQTLFAQQGMCGHTPVFDGASCELGKYLLTLGDRCGSRGRWEVVKAEMAEWVDVLLCCNAASQSPSHLGDGRLQKSSTLPVDGIFCLVSA